MQGTKIPRRRHACALALMLSIPLAATAMEPPTGSGRAVAIEQIVKSWESTEVRLSELQVELPAAAHDGIQRAIEANRTGRERALAALEAAGSAAAAGRARAQEALAEAAARMREGIGRGAAAVATAPAPGNRPFSGDRPAGTGMQESAGRPDVTPPIGGRPDVMPPVTGRPAGAGRPQSPGKRPGG